VTIDPAPAGLAKLRSARLPEASSVLLRSHRGWHAHRGQATIVPSRLAHLGIDTGGHWFHAS
jgi:hypothetical protein